MIFCERGKTKVERKGNKPWTQKTDKRASKFCLTQKEGGAYLLSSRDSRDKKKN